MHFKLLSNIITFGIAVCLFAYTESADSGNAQGAGTSNGTAISEKKPYYDISFFSDDISWQDGVEQAVAITGIVVGSLVILGGLAWVLTPVFGYRICTFLGNCETPTLTHSSGGNLQDPGQANAFPSDMYNSVVSPYMSGYRKRSLRYVGPLLKTLASAYEKFEQQTPSTKTD